MRRPQSERETALLKYAKRNIPSLEPEDDPFGDKELFETETARYFAVAGNATAVDPGAKGNFRILVETDMFGGTHKHLHGAKYEEAKSFLRK